jgi:hypothetical protein
MKMWRVEKAKTLKKEHLTSSSDERSIYMSQAVEERLYADLWAVINGLAVEEAPKSRQKAISLIEQNCSSLPYPNSVDLYISLAQIEFPRVQKEEGSPFLTLNPTGIYLVSRCCAEHNDIERQIKLEKIVEELKEIASSNSDLEQELRYLDLLKLIRMWREREEGVKSEVVAPAIGRNETEVQGIRTVAADIDGSKVMSDNLSIEARLELINVRAQVDFLDKRTGERFVDMQGRIDDKLSNKYLMVGLIATIFIGVLGVLIAILVSLPK